MAITTKGQVGADGAEVSTTDTNTIANAPSEAEIAAAKAVLAASGNGNTAPPRFRVIVSNKLAGDRTLFSSVSKKRAQKYIEDHCPRGSHFFLLTPDGETLSYEHERHSGGPQGEDVEVWQPFDREAYQAPTLDAMSTSNDPWADAWEGAQ
jgi:hypothetical protein